VLPLTLGTERIWGSFLVRPKFILWFCGYVRLWVMGSLFTLEVKHCEFSPGER
jgi:hypothetical protein